MLILLLEIFFFIVFLFYENIEYLINNILFISELINIVLKKKVYKNFLNVYILNKY